MTYPSASTPAYYLAIRGDQIGPLTESQVVKLVRKEKNFEEILVWYEGMVGWVPLTEIYPFQEFFGTPKTITTFDSRNEQLEKTNFEATYTKSAEPAFHSSKPPPPLPASFASKKSKSQSAYPRRRRRKESWLERHGLTLVFLAGLVLLTTIFYPSEETESELAEEVPRPQRLERALASLSEKPGASIPQLVQIVTENPKDLIGQQALRVSTEYLLKNQKHKDAAHVFMRAGQYPQAAELYLKPPADFPRAEAATFKIYQVTKDPTERKKYLQKDIDLLLGPMNSPAARNLASTRIRQFSKEFPQSPNPYGYYLLTTEERIADVFARLLPFYTRSLNELVQQKMPSVKLLQSPSISVRKDGAGRFRVEATYQADVMIGKERKPNIRMVFWSHEDQWHLVESLLSPEIQKAAANQKLRLLDKGLTAAQMLTHLENLHTHRFPSRPLHVRTAQNRP